MLYNAQLTSNVAQDLLKEGESHRQPDRALLRTILPGVYVIGFSYPVVPEGEARIRVQLSALHTKKQLTEAIEKFAMVRAVLCFVRKPRGLDRLERNTRC